MGEMELVALKLIDCKPLKARITKTACERNQKLVKDYKQGGYVSAYSTGTAFDRWISCKDCPKFTASKKLKYSCKQCGRVFTKGRCGYCPRCWAKRSNAGRPRKS